MAKRKRKSTGSRRRRRVSGIGATGAFTPILGGILGAVGAKLINDKLGSKVDPKILAAGEIIAAAMFVPKMIKGPLGTGVAVGLGAAGGLTLAQSTGMISGFYDVPTINGPGMKRIAAAGRQMLSGVAANTRAFGSGGNFATNRSQMQVISGIESQYADDYNM